MDYKIVPIRKRIQELGVTRQEPAEMWLGISTDEIHRTTDSRVNYITNRYPLIEHRLSRASIRIWIDRHYPRIPVGKSACVGCPFRSDQSYLELTERDPAALRKAIAADHLMRENYQPSLKGTPYLHRSGRPLADVLQDLQRGQTLQPELFGNECEGVCGV